MKKILKSRIFAFILGALIFSSISVYAAHKYAASDITYKNTTLDQALNTLYTTQNTTVSNLQSHVSNLTSVNETLTNEKAALQSQINTKDATISSLQSQLNSLTTAASNFHFTSSTSVQTFNLGFKPKYINCFSNFKNIEYESIIYNYDYDSSHVYKVNTADSYTYTYSMAIREIAPFFTINNNGFSWNINSSEWNGVVVYCTASK
ncbi:MAG: hypothetical protein E7158_04320 [Firmicutes bacterium]|nr:hypothetical protein [Bacillota bacterium]